MPILMIYGEENLSSKVHLKAFDCSPYRNRYMIGNISIQLLYHKQALSCRLSLSHSLTYTLTPHTLSMFQNAWWPIYYWRGTPTDKQIPRNEVI